MLRLHHPTRIAIDGITASGKTIFAKALADYLTSNSYNVIYTSLDGFHNPKEIRHEKGRLSSDGYYFDVNAVQLKLSLSVPSFVSNGSCYLLN